DPAHARVPLYRDAGCAAKLTLYLAHNDVKGVLTEVGRLFDKSAPQRLADRTFDTADDDDDSLREVVEQRYVRVADRQWKALQRDTSLKAKVAHLKALLIAADGAGSALT